MANPKTGFFMTRLICNKGMVADQSTIGFATCQGLIGNQSATVQSRYGNRFAVC